MRAMITWPPAAAGPAVRAARGGLSGRRVQAVVIGLVVLVATAASTLALGLLVDSNAPFDHAFAAQHGSEVTATSKASPAQLAATARLPGVTAVAGERIDRLSETGLARFRRRQVGMIFQFFNLLDDMTVLDNVLLPAQLAGMPAARARARADELLTALRIVPYRNAYPARLSGGQRQRVAIARALVNRPALLLADEPTGALDTATGEEIGELLAGLNSSGQTLILVTHNPDLAARYASRVIEIVDGRVASDAVAGARR